MIFQNKQIDGGYVIEPELKKDWRRYFTPLFCKEEFKTAGIDFDAVQISKSFTKEKGTLRGLHFQREPKWEQKVVQCTRGSVYNVVADVRKKSPTFGKWFGIELNESNRKMVYTPKGFVNGCQTLSDNSELLYWIGEYYVLELTAGIKYDDPTFNIIWPYPPFPLSQKNKKLPFLKETQDNLYTGELLS